MTKGPGFAKAFAGRRRIVEMDIRLRLRTRPSSSTACELQSRKLVTPCCGKNTSEPAYSMCGSAPG